VRRIAISALLFATLASGQWLGPTFRVPDTFGLPRRYLCMVHDPDLGVMYIAGDESDSILVVDDQTYRPVERFSVGVSSGIGALARPHDRPLLFCALCDRDRVVALDCETHQPVAQYDVGGHPAGLLYCGAEGKMYVANWSYTGSVSVIDLNVDSVVATIPRIDASYLNQGMCYSPGSRRLFCINARDNEVVVIDALSDTVLARVRMDGWPTALVYNTVNNRVYVACKEDGLYSIDAATLSVTAVLQEVGLALALACDSVRNRVYVPVESTLVVVDGTADTVIGRVAIDGNTEWVGFDSPSNKAIVVSEYDSWSDNPYTVAVVDGDSLALVRMLSGPGYLDAIGQWGSNGDVFCAGDGMVGVYDAVRSRPVGMLTDWCDVLSLSADSVGGKLYCVSDWPHQVIVLDQETNRVRTTIPLTHYPGPVCFNTVDRKVYVGSEETEGPGIVTVLDGVGDTLIGEIELGGTPDLLAYNRDEDVLYATGGGPCPISVVDGKGDSVIGYVETEVMPETLAYNVALRKLYAISYDGAVAVIDPRTNRQIKYIDVGGYVGQAALNSSGSRLYIGGYRADSVYVIDCTHDTLVRAISVTAGSPSVLCYDAIDDLLYVGSSFSADSGFLSVIDCARDEAITVLPVETRRLLHDRQTNAVYVLGYSHITVIDGQSRTILRTFETDFHPDYIASAKGWPCVYVGANDGPYISVINKAPGPAEMGVQTVPDAQATVVRGRLNWTGTLAVMYDMGGRRVLDVHRGGNDVSRLRPGVYFIRQNGVRRGTYARKIVIAD
jgi:DNA-binding beta-propeller fold protein YncE